MTYFCIDFRSEEEKYLDGLIAEHEEGEHEDRKVRNCPDCEVQVEEQPNQLNQGGASGQPKRKRR